MNEPSGLICPPLVEMNPPPEVWIIIMIPVIGLPCESTAVPLMRANRVGVMGIRAVQAGALTSAIDRPLPGDHPEMEDFARAGHGELSCRAVVVGAARRQPPVRS